MGSIIVGAAAIILCLIYVALKKLFQLLIKGITSIENMIVGKSETKDNKKYEPKYHRFDAKSNDNLTINDDDEFGVKLDKILKKYSK